MNNWHPLFDLPIELQDEVFSHLSKIETEPFQWCRLTHLSARRRLWRHVKINLSTLYAFFGFVHTDDRFRHLIQELTLPIAEPWIVDRHNEWGDFQRRVSLLPIWWDVTVIEQLLTRLPGLTSLTAETWRGLPPSEYHGQRRTFREYTETPLIRLPKHITRLEVLEDINANEYGPGRRNLGLFAAASSIKQVSYSTGLRWKWGADSLVGGAASFEHVQDFANVRVLTLHNGERAVNTADSMLNIERVLKSLKVLRHLRDLEIWLPFWTGDKGIPENWPALLPALRVFRTTTRRVVLWIARTTRVHEIHFQVLVAEAEMENPRLWKDEQMVTTTFKLLEETAHYLSKHKTDKRRLSLACIDVLTGTNYRQMNWRTFSHDASPDEPGWEYDDLYYPPPTRFLHHGRGMTGEYDRYWSMIMASMPGLTDDREEYVFGCMDALGFEHFLGLAVEPWEEVKKWKPRGNLGLNWGNTLRSTQPGYVDVTQEEYIGFH